MAAYDRIKLLCVKNTLHSVKVSSSPNSPLSQMFFQIDVLKNFADLTGNHQCWSLARNFIKNRCFPVKFANFLGTPFFHQTPPLAASDKPRRSL